MNGGEKKETKDNRNEDADKRRNVNVPLGDQRKNALMSCSFGMLVEIGMQRFRSGEEFEQKEQTKEKQSQHRSGTGLEQLFSGLNCVHPMSHTALNDSDSKQFLRPSSYIQRSSPRIHKAFRMGNSLSCICTRRFMAVVFTKYLVRAPCFSSSFVRL
jgi:hypothetical protein